MLINLALLHNLNVLMVVLFLSAVSNFDFDPNVKGSVISIGISENIRNTSLSLLKYGTEGFRVTKCFVR